jgi:dTDP-4-amino-4,6-dideoxygalactose transaminase
MVPFNDPRRRFLPIRDRVLSEWAELLAGGRYIGGPPLEAFEIAFRTYCGAAECVGVANGTDAIELALRALDVRSGHEVITVPNAGGYTTTACIAIGARPIYVDVEAETGQMDLSQLTQKLTAATRVVVATHLFGYANDVAALRGLLNEIGRSDVKILEDCAQAHGARLHGAMAGAAGDAGVYSFYPTKNLGAVGDAGAVICQGAPIAEKVRSLAQYGWSTKYKVSVSGGRNSRMDPLQAMVLLAQLPSLDEWNGRRRSICEIYAKALPAGWNLIHSEDERFAGHLAVAIAPSAQARSRAQQALTERRIGHDVHYPVLDCDQPAWAEPDSFEEACPVARSLVGRIVSLPCFPELTDREITEVVEAVRGFH